MPSRRSSPRWIVAAALLAGCASTPPRSDTTFWCRVDLPVATAAAIVAGAMHAATGLLDPAVPNDGAPAQRGEPERFVVAYGRDRDGHWVSLASHRLRLIGAGTGAAVPPTAVVTRLGAARRTDDRATATTPIELEVRGEAHAGGAATIVATIVTGTVPAELRPALERALALAMDPDAPLCGLEEPNLAVHTAWRLAQRVEAAQAAGDQQGAFALQQRIADLGHASPALQLELGDAEAARGDDDGARNRYWRALAGTDDPLLRATLARRLAALQPHADAAADWRAAARSALAGDDLDRAALLLHRARRSGEAKAIDYRLLGEFHRRRTEPMAAFANDLLAREHAGVPTGEAQLAHDGHGPTAARQLEAAASLRPHVVPTFAAPLRD